MKKNVMMRVASVMMVLVLMTSSVISGTFAKYVTEATGSDAARVAKWGVQLRVGGGSFSDTYATDDATTFTGKVSVDSEDGADVVAPGTKDDGSAAFSITGTPEVATKIDVIIDDNFKDVYLKAGTYTDFTKVIGYTEDEAKLPLYSTFKLDKDYYPIVYTLTQTKSATPGKVMVPVSGNLNTIKKALAAYTATAAYAPNTTLDAEFKLSWKWAFDGAQNLNDTDFDKDTVDKADTWLGNAAAGIIYDSVTAGMDKDYNLTIAYDLTVTATQIN